MMQNAFLNIPVPKNIKMAQIVQSKDGNIRIKIVPGDEFSKTDEKYVLYKVKEIIGPIVDVNTELVENIDRTKSGKFKFIISEIETPYNGL